MKRLAPFSTERLVALPLRAEDLQELRRMHEDPAVMKFVGGVRTEEETERWLQDNLQHWNFHGFGLWTFRHITHGAFVGRCGLRRVQLDSSDEVELGYSLVPQYWGKGLATEMVKAVLAIGFEDIGLQSVIALVYAANTKSRSVAERMCFHFERKTLWKGSQAMVYRLKRGQWTNTATNVF